MLYYFQYFHPVPYNPYKINTIRLNNIQLVILGYLSLYHDAGADYLGLS